MDPNFIKSCQKSLRAFTLKGSLIITTSELLFLEIVKYWITTPEIERGRDDEDLKLKCKRTDEAHGLHLGHGAVVPINNDFESVIKAMFVAVVERVII